MKKICVAYFVLFLFISCKPDKTDYREKIKGKWNCQEINYLILPTEEAFTVVYGDNGSSFSFGSVYNMENNAGKQWMESSGYTYSLNGETLSVKGTNAKGELVDASYSIHRFNGNSMDCREEHCRINGTEVSANRNYTFYRSGNSGHSRLIGSWLAKERLSGDSVTDFRFRYDFKEDHEVEMYEKKNGEWVMVTDPVFTYFLNGDLLSVNKQYAAPSALSYEYEGWIIEEWQSDKMVWRQWIRMPGSQNLWSRKYELYKSD